MNEKKNGRPVDGKLARLENLSKEMEELLSEEMMKVEGGCWFCVSGNK